MRFARWICLLLVGIPLLSMGPTSGVLNAQEKKEAQPKKVVAYGFKEYRIGMKFDDLEATVGRYEGDDLRQQGGFQDTIAGEDCFVFLVFEDYGKGLQLDFIGVTAEKSAFGTIMDALRAKYGRPATAQVITKKNGMGVSFSGRRFLWYNGVSAIEAEELGAKVDECRFVWTARGLGRSKADRAKKTKAATDI